MHAEDPELAGLGSLAAVVDPRRWLDDLADRLLAESGLGDATDARVLSMSDLVAHAVMRTTFDRFVADGVPEQAAATYLVGWFASPLAALVGLGLSVAEAGFCADPSTVAWTTQASGWPEAVTFTPERIAVAAGHPWAARPDVDVVDDLDAVVDEAVAALVAVVEPVVEAAHELTRIGYAGLWNEVGDSLCTVLADQRSIEPTARRLDILRRASRATAGPWRKHADLWTVEPPPLGRIHVVRKGGCCLAYTETHGPVDLDDPDLDPDRRAFLDRFPEVEGEPAYCDTCCFRTLDDAAARQAFWFGRRWA